MMKKGFTLIEAILTIAILAAGVMAVLTLFQQNIAKSDEMEETLMATLLAEEKLEQMIQDKKYQGYVYIIAANYPASQNLAGEGYAAYTRTITIQEVDPADLKTPKIGTGYKKITVAVQVTGGPTITINTLVTSWGAG